ncbi:MAG: lytic transglycosylase domain-containing protein [Bacteroidetes bacterium]|nr:lytic transglycosylase domain-containing protein [Bacteroidota bacterium]
MFRELYEQVACAATEKAQISAAIFFSLIQKESGWNPKSSGSGSYGIAQINPVSHPAVDVWNPVDSLFYAAQLLRNYLNIYANKHNPYEYALSAYNVGNTTVNNWKIIPQWELDSYVNPILLNSLNEASACVTATPTPTLPPSITQHQETPQPELLLVFLLSALLRNFR